MVPPKIITIVKKFIRTVKESGIKVDEVFIFGSYVRGKATQWSDIDVAVISSDFENNDRHKWGVKLLKIASDIDYRIEPIPLGAKSFAKDNWVPLIYEIKTTGIPIKIAA